jgi:hypothetical protein
MPEMRILAQERADATLAPQELPHNMTTTHNNDA